jgi:hypothetical protein
MPTPTPGGPRAADPTDRAVRAYYAAIGMVMATSWIGANGEPIWKHAVRTLLIVALVPAIIAVSRRRTRSAVSTQSLPRVLLIQNGLFLAALGLSWLISYVVDSGHVTLFGTILRFSLLPISIPFQVQAARRRAAGIQPSPNDIGRLSFLRFLAAKVVLLAVALAAQAMLGHSFAHAEYVISGALLVIVARFGPRVHPYLLVPDRGSESPATFPVATP